MVINYIKFLLIRLLKDFKTFKSNRKHEIIAEALLNDLIVKEKEEIKRSIQLSAIDKQRKKVEEKLKRQTENYYLQFDQIQTIRKKQCLKNQK